MTADETDLREFVATRSSAAFERLARRHAGAVYSVCLMRLACPADAEDASQAVFIALARKAASVRPERLGAWLHGAAVLACRKLTESAQIRARREKEAAMRTEAPVEPDSGADEDWERVRPHLVSEVERLPAPMREAVVRHYLGGRSLAEVASELGLPRTTVAGRVRAGVERLRQRLVRRDVRLGADALGTLLAARAAAEPPAGLLAALLKLGSGAAAAGTGAKAASVAEGVLKAMFWTKVKIAAAALAGAAVLGGGAVIGVRAAETAERGEQPMAGEARKLCPEERAARLKELKALQFGMMIHWGPGMRPAYGTQGTWKSPEQYSSDPSFFQPEGCDPEQWVRVAKEAGMRYVLPVTKHHNGFCLWDTATTDFKSTQSLLKRDLIEEVRKLCNDNGMKLGLYFSLADSTWGRDWANVGGRENARKIMREQLTELMTQFGPVEYWWFDTFMDEKAKTLSHQEILDLIKSLDPKCFVGFQHPPGAELGDMKTHENGRPANIPASDDSIHECARRIGKEWFWMGPDDTWCSPPDEVYGLYRDAARLGHLYLCNVGPMGNGKLRPVDVRTLQWVGRMIRGEVPSLTKGRPAAVSGGKANPRWPVENAVDGDFSTVWRPGGGGEVWLEVDLGAESTFNRLVIGQGADSLIRKLALQYKAGGDWKTCWEAQGDPLGFQDATFEPVTACVVRLGILDAAEGANGRSPQISEFVVFKEEDKGK